MLLKMGTKCKAMGFLNDLVGGSFFTPSSLALFNDAPNSSSFSCCDFQSTPWGFFLVGKVVEAEECFRKMVKDGCKPNVVTYTTLLNGNCKMELSVAVIQLLKKMEKEHNIMPDIVPYGTIIDGLCNEGLVDRALDLFLKMTRKDVAPEVVTYTSLIHEACIVRPLNNAVEFMKIRTK
ncbi:hypothetical protein TIFTF001_028840 [Ficus carica]|uniref:Pentatricopeptide repeat-containing protein n=1 Tax=Ficus carica TaxID=3494 RepID=A0AA88DRA0_FICCA|nr:hypothetical protein TIFTF001_028840 [Ficus carica]